MVLGATVAGAETFRASRRPAGAGRQDEGQKLVEPPPRLGLGADHAL